MADLSEIIKGKIVSFSVEEDILPMRVERVQILAEEAVVMGTINKGETTNDWAAGVLCGISWSKTSHFLVFSSEDVYNEAMKKSNSL